MERDRGTNLVLTAVREAEPIRLRTAPLIFLSTILTHLVGGSAGREGAALQLGGSIGAWVGRKIHLDEKDRRIMVMCGMSAAFSGLFGTPITAAIFAMEVVSVGVMYYAAIVPCVVSSLVSVQLARFFGLHIGTGYLIGNVAVLGPWSMAQVCVMGVLCALLSILFCKVMHAAPKLYAKYFPNPLVRAAVGGALVLLLTLLVGEQTYNGAGDAVIRRMLAGETISEAFLLKLVFTALTLGAGFRGGEIVPVLFTGAAFGTVVGPLLGLSQSFGGALGMTAVFCGATTAPSPPSSWPMNYLPAGACLFTPCAVPSPTCSPGTTAFTASRRSSTPNSRPPGWTERRSSSPCPRRRSSAPRSAAEWWSWVLCLWAAVSSATSM